jgi:hypothetical protein
MTIPEQKNKDQSMDCTNDCATETLDTSVSPVLSVDTSSDTDSVSDHITQGISDPDSTTVVDTVTTLRWEKDSIELNRNCTMYCTMLRTLNDESRTLESNTSADETLAQCQIIVDVPPRFPKELVQSIIDYCTVAHSQKPSVLPKPLPWSKVNELLTFIHSWERRWVQHYLISRGRVQLEQIYQTIECCEWLGVSSLSQLCGACIAVGLRNKSTQSMQQALNLNTFEPTFGTFSPPVVADDLWIKQWNGNVFPIVSARYCQR